MNEEKTLNEMVQNASEQQPIDLQDMMWSTEQNLFQKYRGELENRLIEKGYVKGSPVYMFATSLLGVTDEESMPLSTKEVKKIARHIKEEYNRNNPSDSDLIDVLTMFTKEVLNFYISYDSIYHDSDVAIRMVREIVIRLVDDPMEMSDDEITMVTDLIYLRAKLSTLLKDQSKLHPKDFTLVSKISIATSIDEFIEYVDSYYSGPVAIALFILKNVFNGMPLLPSEGMNTLAATEYETLVKMIYYDSLDTYEQQTNISLEDDDVFAIFKTSKEHQNIVNMAGSNAIVSILDAMVTISIFIGFKLDMVDVIKSSLINLHRMSFEADDYTGLTDLVNFIVDGFELYDLFDNYGVNDKTVEDLNAF